MTVPKMREMTQMISMPFDIQDRKVYLRGGLSLMTGFLMIIRDKAPLTMAINAKMMVSMTAQAYKGGSVPYISGSSSDELSEPESNRAEEVEESRKETKLSLIGDVISTKVSFENE